MSTSTSGAHPTSTSVPRGALYGRPAPLLATAPWLRPKAQGESVRVTDAQGTSLTGPLPDASDLRQSRWWNRGSRSSGARWTRYAPKPS